MPDLRLPALLGSTGFRLAAVYAALFAASALIVVGFIRIATNESLTRELDASIRADVDSLSERYRAEGMPGLILLIRNRTQGEERTGAVYALADPFGKMLAGNLREWPAHGLAVDGAIELPVERAGRRSVARVQLYSLPGGFRLLAGRDAEERIELRRSINEILLAGVALTTVLAIAGGYLFRRMVLKRVEAIRRTATSIVAGHLAIRLPAGRTDDEFDLLARTLNEMLDKIEQLMDGVRDVANAIAHDLRTPLTRVRARIEELSAGRLQGDEESAALEGVQAEIDELLRTFSALLRIAEVDAGAKRGTFAEIRVVPLLEDAAELYRAVAEDQGVALILKNDKDDLTVMGDGQLMAQAIGNLIDNAIKYGRDGREVVISASKQLGVVRLSVADHGPGIPESERSRVTERFYRGEQSRSRPGSGLGLSLAAAVARLHSGHLELADNEPGLLASIVLPGNAPA